MRFSMRLSGKPRSGAAVSRWAWRRGPLLGMAGLLIPALLGLLLALAACGGGEVVTVGSLDIEMPVDDPKAVGPADAPVVIVEYADFQCPFCRELARGAGKQIIEEYAKAGKVRFLFRQYPFLGEESLWAAQASECAAEQGKFWDYYDKLFAEWRGENTGAFSQTNLVRYAADLGLDVDSFSQCLDSEKYLTKVVAEKEEGEQQGVTSTPTLFINRRKITGVHSFKTYRSIIESELSMAP